MRSFAEGKDLPQVCGEAFYDAMKQFLARHYFKA
jgi:hypothetical protein